MGPVRGAIAAVIAGGEAALVQTSWSPLPDYDGFGGTHRATFEAAGVCVTEVIACNEEGSAREGHGYRMSWDFAGTGAREGHSAAIVAYYHEPVVNQLVVEVTEPDAEVLQLRLSQLLGQPGRSLFRG
jgi:hypothetical protein